MANQAKTVNTQYVVGRNAVKEALKAGRAVETLYVLNIKSEGSVGEIIRMAKRSGVVVKQVDKHKLDSMSGQENHQGIIALAAAKESVTIEEILDIATKKGEQPFVILTDDIEDPHNLGAIIRTAECAGAHGVIIPKRRNAGITEAVWKSSAGALEYMPIARVSNLSSTIEKLKKLGIWIYAADMNGERWCDQDLTGPVALVIGSEGKGISPLVRKNCDFVLSLPMSGKINSLNASVAAGILMYEVRRQRK